MVQVREAYPRNPDGTVNIDQWLARLPIDHSHFDLGLLREACQWSEAAEKRAKEEADTPDNAWSSTASSFLTGLEMAEILADFKLDQDSLVCAVLYRAVREKKLALEKVRGRFGPVVAKLIEGVQQMAAISAAHLGIENIVLGQNQAQGEKVRKMLVALIDDVRVALIKLAERTCAIRAVKDRPDKQQRVAREIFEIYAPLAHRLGIGHIKWELEDLSFRYLHPDEYKRIAKLLDERRLDRQQYIDRVLGMLREALERGGIRADLAGRAKHIFSIWRKMQRKGIGFSQVYDIRALRVLVPEVKDCYAALGIVHTLWRNIPHEFDDYIAIPKENGYRSLHTAVIGPEGKVLEVQIRTFDMHEEAEFGVCAHWRYKGHDARGKSINSYEEKIAWLRQVLEWQEEMGSAGGLQAELREIGQDRVYVFTPDGHVVDLALGATPLDFAYHIHTEVGHRCRGAKVNGRIVPLSYPLKTGEQVEIITGRESTPSRDWLLPSLGYLRTPRARAKVQHWFKSQAREQRIADGRQLIEKEFRRLALTGLDHKALAERVGCTSVDDMHALLGAGDLGAAQVVAAAQSMVEGPSQVEQLPLLHEPRQQQSSGVEIVGVGNVYTAIAQCCRPVPGDAITGFIARGRGVRIHRQDCPKILALQQSMPERIIEVSWGQRPEQTYPVEIVIEAFDRHGLLRDITQMLANAKVNVTSLNTRSDPSRNTARMKLTVEITGLDALARVLDKLNRLPNVISAERSAEGRG